MTLALHVNVGRTNQHNRTWMAPNRANHLAVSCRFMLFMLFMHLADAFIQSDLHW